ncbi:hypothetical protein Taro_013576 [Colocasia esculenta]|uniref:CCHC-type domain-containing protein n=1 Tax=Colocasia esculenta TaxID=4460 RepID=A0A843UCF6_COLES|nr:hypothetical protein [Colocasia esculenta]
MRGECPELKKKLKKEKFTFKKAKAMLATWSDEDEDENSQATSGDDEVQCLMARSNDSNEVNSSFETCSVDEWEEAYTVLFEKFYEFKSENKALRKKINSLVHDTNHNEQIASLNKEIEMMKVDEQAHSEEMDGMKLKWQNVQKEKDDLSNSLKTLQDELVEVKEKLKKAEEQLKGKSEDLTRYVKGKQNLDAILGSNVFVAKHGIGYQPVKPKVRYYSRHVPKQGSKDQEKQEKQVTAIEEANDQKRMLLETLIGSLMAHEINMERLGESSSRKKHSNALKATEGSSEEESEDEGSNEDSEDEEALMSRRLQHILAKKKFQSGRKFFKKGKDFKKPEGKDVKKSEPTCYKCKKPGHIKADCPKLKKTEFKKKDNSKKFRRYKKKAMAVAWNNESDSDSESSSSDEEEEKSNMAFKANTNEKKFSLFISMAASGSSGTVGGYNIVFHTVDQQERFSTVKTKLCGNKAVDIVDLEKNGMHSIVDAIERMKWTRMVTVSETSY